eukprot:scaffold33102_cov50-Attheya_sp.AAC.1
MDDAPESSPVKGARFSWSCSRVVAPTMTDPESDMNRLVRAKAMASSVGLILLSVAILAYESTASKVAADAEDGDHRVMYSGYLMNREEGEAVFVFFLYLPLKRPPANTDQGSNPKP